MNTSHLFLLFDIKNNNGISFVELRKLTASSDGSMASYIILLEKKGLIEVKKQFINRKPNTTYYLTDKAKIILDQFISIINGYSS